MKSKKGHKDFNPEDMMGEKQVKNELTEDEQEFFQYMFKSLPPIIKKVEVDTFLGGIVTAKTLARAESSGRGPEVVWKLGRKVVAYQTESLLLWLIKRSGVTRISPPNKPKGSKKGKKRD